MDVVQSTDITMDVVQSTDITMDVVQRNKFELILKMTCMLKSWRRIFSVVFSTVPNEFLLFASHCCIRRLSLDTPDKTDVYLPLPDLHNAIALDYDLEEEKIYYTDLYKDVIRLVLQTCIFKYLFQIILNSKADDWVFKKNTKYIVF